MKVAVYFATGYEEVEALSVVDVLRRGNIEVIMVGVTGETVTGSHGISINMDKTIDKVDHSTIDMMVLPGGLPGADNLMANTTLTDNLKKFKEEGKWLAAICAAPSILGRLGLLKGEKAICYPGFEDKLLEAEVVNAKAVLSNKIITGIGPGAALDFALKIVEVIKGKEVVDTLKHQMVMDR